MKKENGVIIREYMLPMSDGARLYTRVVLPGEGRFPTVFMRTPYDPETGVTGEMIRRYENDGFTGAGYAVVLQHCRGRYGSEGECIPYSEEERRDGLETLNWLRTLPHYNGELFFSGGSYTASVLLLMLDEDIPDLRAVCLSVQTESMYHRNYFNGLCRSMCGFTWWLSMISPQRPKIAEDRDIFVRPYRDVMKRATGTDLPEFSEELLHDRYDGFWKNDHRIGVMEKLSVPILMTGGWFDYYCYGMCRMWDKLSPETREKSCFLMAPLGHDLRVREGSDYPLSGGILPGDREVAWFDSVRLGKPFPYARPGEFRYYVIGEDRWHAATGPYRNRPLRPMYLSRGGTLTESAPEKGARTFFYDPDKPTHHDRHDYMFRCYDANSYGDVLSFVSEPFNEDAVFFGPVEYDLTVSSDCDDTAFFMRLYLVEDGISYNVVDAATTLLHADPEFRAGEVCSLRVISQPTALKVKKGCRLRVDVSSYSDCFVPHSNTAVPFALAEEVRIARNTVFCGESAVLLPGS